MKIRYDFSDVSTLFFIGLLFPGLLIGLYIKIVEKASANFEMPFYYGVLAGGLVFLFFNATRVLLGDWKTFFLFAATTAINSFYYGVFFPIGSPYSSGDSLGMAVLVGAMAASFWVIIPFGVVFIYSLLPYQPSNGRPAKPSKPTAPTRSAPQQNDTAFDFDPSRFGKPSSTPQEPKTQSAAKPTQTTSEAARRESSADKTNVTAPSDDQSSPLTALEELDKMIGLDPVKEQVRRLHAKILFDQKRAATGAKPTKQSMHMVFTGSPGTGKTTVARIVGRILNDLGILDRPNVHEVTRTNLVAEYVGQTAPKTAGEIEKALGGVLFIDEADSLSPADGRRDFGSEAIDTILREMENHRDKLVVIVAGYEAEMERFIGSNPGLQSRFKNTINFPDYSASEMYRIFEMIAQMDHFALTDDARSLLQHHFTILEQSKGPHFGNGRDVRNVFEDCTSNLALRTVNVSETDKAAFSTITAADIPKPKALSAVDTALWNTVQNTRSTDTERSAALKKLATAIASDWPKELSHSR